MTEIYQSVLYRDVPIYESLGWTVASDYLRADGTLSHHAQYGVLMKLPRTAAAKPSKPPHLFSGDE